MAMNTLELKESLSLDAPPAELTPPLQGLWWEAHGDWDRGHRIVQQSDDRDAAWVHAYLHRKEPDLSNASYWYARAGKPVASGSFDAEWDAIARALLGS
jgi:hypothetical protein